MAITSLTVESVAYFISITEFTQCYVGLAEAGAPGAVGAVGTADNRPEQLRFLCTALKSRTDE